MFKPWITIPAKDVVVMNPTCTHDDYKIMFKDTAVIDKTIELLEDLKVLVAETEKAVRKNDE